jgi:enamine deaminase RidA (YjgF/YER057c/UK114 family)
MEIWQDEDSQKAEYLTYKEIRYTRSYGEMGVSIYGMGLCHSNMHVGIHEQAHETFNILVEILQKEGLSLSDIVRQWNYIPGILSMENLQGKSLQHYQAFNEVRKHWYSQQLFTNGYPAATGIGVETGPFSIDFIAMTSNPSLKKTGLYNPKQVNAYQYAQQHLVGEALHGKYKNPPLFERAKLLSMPKKSLVFVSGTAAILGQETVGLGDVCKQTEISINNMMELISPIVTHTNQPFRFNYVRVYIKEAAYRDAIKSVCDNHFPDTPTSFVLAEVCRDNLLMEIEGEAIIS